jgi:hypothetical protein
MLAPETMIHRNQRLAAPCFPLLLIPGIHLIILIVFVGAVIWVGVFSDPRVTTVPLLVGFALSCCLLVHSLMISYIDRFKPTLCRIRLSINCDIMLMYNSWWPRGLSSDEIECFAMDAAMESALVWYAAHEKEQRLSLSENDAFHLTVQHLSDFSEVEDPVTCPICLDVIEGGAICLKLCRHDFHEDCLVRWFQKSGKILCPYCRKNHNEIIPDKLVRDYKEKSKPVIRIISLELQVGT